MPLEIAQHAEDRDSQRQELEQITHVQPGEDFFQWKCSTDLSLVGS